MSDLPKQLRIKAGMIHRGKRIAWVGDTALMEEAVKLMEEAAKLIEQQQADIDRLSRLHDEWCQVFDPLADYVRANNLAKIGDRKVDALIESHKLQQAEIVELYRALRQCVKALPIAGDSELQDEARITALAALAKAKGDNNE